MAVIRNEPERVILESPYAGDVHLNVAYARASLRDSLLRGEAPIASHLLYTQPGVLNDAVPEERRMGIEAGLAWLGVARKSVVYVDLGVSGGMMEGINRASRSNGTVEVRKLPDLASIDSLTTPESIVSDLAAVKLEPTEPLPLKLTELIYRARVLLGLPIGESDADN